MPRLFCLSVNYSRHHMAWYNNFIITFLFISHSFLCLIFSDLTKRIKWIDKLSLIHVSLVASNKPSWHNVIWRLVIRVRKPKKSSFRSVFLGGFLGCPWPPLPVGLFLSKQPTIFRWRKRYDNIFAVKAIVEKPTFFNLFFCKLFS